MMLADMGARVIKVEHPVRGDDTRHWGPPFQNGESAYFLSINRGKESVALDFSVAQGRALLDRLVAHADVLIENFRPGTLTKYGLDYASLSAGFPALIYCSISGFGQTGPRSREAGYDAIAQAEGGLMSVTGLPDGPPIRPGVPIADIATGMFAAYGIAAALFDRQRTGRGRQVDTALLDSIAALMTYQASTFFATGQSPRRLGNRHALIAPYDVFTATDGEFVLAVGNDDQWRRCCHAIGLPELADDPRFRTNRERVERSDEMAPILAAQFLSRPTQEWLERLGVAGVPAGRVRSVGDAVADPQLTERGMIATVEHPVAGVLQFVSSPVKLSGTPGSAPVAPPTLGQHTDSVLRELLGLEDAELEELEAQGVITRG
jgi:crotonobetainyl-CoA:carnitine CoA-transferase CaiB-like acyl-CoA transferase